MFVVDVPERDLVEYTQGIRKFEEYDGFEPRTDDAPHRSHELLHVWNVLKRMTTDDGVRFDVRVFVRVEVGDPREAICCVRLDPFRVNTGIDPCTSPDASLSHHHEELALAAADLEYGAAREVISVHPTLGKRRGEINEPLRKGLRLLVASRVLRKGRIERYVGDESARPTEPQVDVTATELFGGFPGR